MKTTLKDDMQAHDGPRTSCGAEDGGTGWATTAKDAGGQWNWPCSGCAHAGSGSWSWSSPRSEGRWTPLLHLAPLGHCSLSSEGASSSYGAPIASPLLSQTLPSSLPSSFLMVSHTDGGTAE